MDNVLGSSEICQVALVVRNIEQSAKRFAELFGVNVPEIHMTAPQEAAHTRYKGNPTAARAKLAFFNLGSLSLELIEPVGGPSTWKEFLDKNGDGLHHIAFRIKDMEGVLKGLSEKGIGVVQQGDYTGGRYTYLDSSQALGVVIELLENFGA